MLKSLNIINFALIPKLHVELEPGLCLLTGETGAGKSIIVDALGLLLGRRGGAELIRTGAEMAVVEGVFELRGTAQREVEAILEGVGVARSRAEELIVRKELHGTGRGRIFVNDQRITAATLRLLQPRLLEIQGQGEQYALASTHSQLELLDLYAGCGELREGAARLFQRWQAASDALSEIRRKVSERERLGDFLRYQLAEIEKVAPVEGEEASLSAERHLLTHAEKALGLCSKGHFDLYESDESVLSRLASIRKGLEELAQFDGRGAEWVSMVESAALLLNEVADNLRGFGSGVDFSPQRLTEVEERLAELEALKRKYRRDVGGLQSLRQELRERLAELETEAEREEGLVELVGQTLREYMALGRELSQKRSAAAPLLERSVESELRHLALGSARFQVLLETAAVCESRVLAEAEQSDLAPPQGASKEGLDRVEFYLSANVGESPKPLGKVASGGELSRLLLGLQTVCARRHASDNVEVEGAEVTLIFDEIDAGIGGKAAEAVGLRLKELARTRQVICVTHQAQIARFADRHYLVSKGVEGGRTVTTMRLLGAEERVGELARMIGGSPVEEAVLETARWMLSASSAGAAVGFSKGKRRR